MKLLKEKLLLKENFYVKEENLLIKLLLLEMVIFKFFLILMLKWKLFMIYLLLKIKIIKKFVVDVLIILILN